jgi:hypothetical protein
LLLALAAPSAAPAFEIVGFGAAVSGDDGVFSRQAGAHADLRFRVGFPYDLQGERPEADVRDVRIDLPPGFTANPAAVPSCEIERFTSVDVDGGCPPDTQIGVASVEPMPGERIPAPVFNIERPPDSVGLFGLSYGGAQVFFQAQVRPGEYGISALSARISQAGAVAGFEIELWANPADPSHDTARGGASDLAPTAFLTNSTSCPSNALTFAAEADFWQRPGLFSRASVDADLDGIPFRFEGCERLDFDPAFTARSGSRRAGAPTGFQLDLALAADEGPVALAGARTRNLTATLPRGFAISPSGVPLVSGCGPEQIALGTNDPPTCPASSRIGTVRIETPLVDRPLEGAVVLAAPHRNPFGALLALYLLVEGPGFYLKLPGRGELDPSTGQLTLSFTDLPQLPFTDLRLDLPGGSDALLAAPSACGEYRTDAEITSWSTNTQVSRSSNTTISEGCASAGFQPELYGGSIDPRAGRATPFALRLSRNDGEQNIARLRATLPAGVSASLGDIPRCPEPGAATASCPATSRVGTALVGIGAGDTPAYIPEAGNAPSAIYLAGPYRGAPLSLLISVPAQTGPFALGTVLVRAAVDLDPRTAQIEVVSDPLPQIIRGVPLSYRDIRLQIDRPDFIRNPTSCEPMVIAGTSTSDLGQSAPLSRRFRVGDCRALSFKPRISLALQGSPGRNGHPALRAILRARSGEAGIGTATIELPAGELLDLRHVGGLCARQLPPELCPPSSRLGRARVWSPLLADPLQGPIYLRAPSGRLPGLVAGLRGGGFRFVLQGHTISRTGRLGIHFPALPDVPLNTAVIALAGGSRGIFVNSEGLCGRAHRAKVSLGAHDERRRQLRPRLRLRGSC